jgi:hypothetical protein
MLLFGSPLAQWSYGYFTDSACTKAGTSISMDGKVQEKTGVALGGCIKNKYGALEWSYSLKSCKVDGNGAPSMQYAGPALRCCCSNAHGLPLESNVGPGRFTEFLEYASKDCSGTGAAQASKTYKNATCVGPYDSSYRKIVLTGTCAAAPCFPSKATVMKADGTSMRVDALVEGDEIVATTEDGTLTTDTVSLLSIRQPEVNAQFLVLATSSNATLTLTPEHHLPVGAACCSMLKKAKDVSVGETVWTIKVGAPAKATVITAISKAPGQGLHSPVLTHGRLPVVDGLVTAFDSIDKVRLAQFGLAPLIAACKKSGTCAKFRELFLAGDGKYVAMAESYRR